MQQFKRYDHLQDKTSVMSKTIAKKHNFIRKIYIYAILFGSLFGMYAAITLLPPVASHLFFSAFCVLYFLAADCF